MYMVVYLYVYLILEWNLIPYLLFYFRYAILNECYNMVKTGLLSAEDVDKLMRDGYGYRYAWIGPLETAVLNADGNRNKFLLPQGQTYSTPFK